jgi:hypothetical protein
MHLLWPLLCDVLVERGVGRFVESRAKWTRFRVRKCRSDRGGRAAKERRRRKANWLDFVVVEQSRSGPDKYVNEE